MDEEKRRLQSTRQQIGDSSGGKRIDLKSGKVTLKGKAKPEQADDEADEAEDQPGLMSTAAGADGATVDSTQDS